MEPALVCMEGAAFAQSCGLPKTAVQKVLRLPI